MKIPLGYQRVMPYLIIPRAEQFLEFSKSTFGATEKMKHVKDDGTIVHAELQIGESTIMFAEGSEEWGGQPAGLFVYVENADETYKKALENGASSILEPRDQDYGRSAGIKDPSGNTWWITSTPSEV